MILFKPYHCGSGCMLSICCSLLVSSLLPIITAFLPVSPQHDAVTINIYTVDDAFRVLYSVSFPLFKAFCMLCQKVKFGSHLFFHFFFKQKWLKTSLSKGLTYSYKLHKTTNYIQVTYSYLQIHVTVTCTNYIVVTYS